MLTMIILSNSIQRGLEILQKENTRSKFDDFISHDLNMDPKEPERK